MPPTQKNTSPKVRALAQIAHIAHYCRLSLIVRQVRLDIFYKLDFISSKSVECSLIYAQKRANEFIMQLISAPPLSLVKLG